MLAMRNWYGHVIGARTTYIPPIVSCFGLTPGIRIVRF